MTGRKTLGFFVNHVNIDLLLCPPLQAIVTIAARFALTSPCNCGLVGFTKGLDLTRE